ncbi:MAG TPA: putative collagen-binding domain-containing protein, partial [Chitinophagaceae bacterium]|nr:putative collagen-binding domain-containing protein [Chitinophagaceae bacterium]
GGAGFTYGHNAVMQYYMPGDTGISFFPQQDWKKGIRADAAEQMQHLKKLFSSYSYFDRIPAQNLIRQNGEQYDRILAAKGKNYAFIYTYTGRNIEIENNKLGFTANKASWFDPRTGIKKSVKGFKAGNILFDPPGEIKAGNDWVLILEK